MRDNELMALIRQELMSALKQLGYSDIEILHSSQRGEKSNKPTIYIHKTIDNRHGSPGCSEHYNRDTQKMERVATEITLSTYQATTSFNYDINDPSALTMSELARIAARAMQLPEFQQALVKRGVNIMRIDKVNYVDPDNKSSTYEELPAFNFQVNHKDIYKTEIPYTGTIIRKMERI